MQQQVRYSRYFGRIIDENGHHWGVLVAIDDKAHLVQAPPEIPAVVQQLVNPLLPCKHVYKQAYQDSLYKDRSGNSAINTNSQGTYIPNFLIFIRDLSKPQHGGGGQDETVHVYVSYSIQMPELSLINMPEGLNAPQFHLPRHNK